MQHITNANQQPGYAERHEPREKEQLPEGWARCGYRACNRPYHRKVKMERYCSETCRYEAVMHRRRMRRDPAADSGWMSRYTGPQGRVYRGA